MIFYFPHWQTLELAITSGAAPAAITSTAAIAERDDQGVFVQPLVNIADHVREALLQLGAELRTTLPGVADFPYENWLAILPLTASEIETADNAPILFELPASLELAELVYEMLRLGNDRQSYRHLTNDAGETKSLLLVQGPPYYSLLRAQAGTAESPQAFYEQAPRVWTQLGWRHPLGERIEPAAGSLLLLKPEGWESIAEEPFRDIYEVIRFTTPAPEGEFVDQPLEQQIEVKLSLKTGGVSDAAEFWLLAEDALAELDKFVAAADNHLLERLSFAVGELQNETRVVVRTRPSRESPPVVVLPAVAFRSYLKLDNLFVPCGQFVHPPLRRDVIARLLAPDPDEIVWLWPTSDGGFAPQTLPDTAFRPLSDWVDYVLDTQQEPLTEWVRSTQFEFEPFICRDDQPSGSVTPPPIVRAANQTGDDAQIEFKLPPQRDPAAPPAVEASLDEAPEFFQPKPTPTVSQLQQQLKQLEQDFLAMTSPLDSSERTEQWFELFRTHHAMGHRLDALLCYGNAAWRDSDLAIQGASIWREETLAETPPVALKNWLARITAGEGFASDDGGELVMLLIWASLQTARPNWLTSRLGLFSQRLEQFEKTLPLRATWLAWRALLKISQGDVLALARARDRALERLYQTGLRPELDLPTFLRVAGEGDSERLRQVRNALPELAAKMNRWIEDSPGDSPYTQCYASLAVSWGWARLGESSRAIELRDSVRQKYADEADEDALHQFIVDSYDYRIEQSISGQTKNDDWNTDLAARLADDAVFDDMDRFRFNRLQFSSPIIDPLEAVSHFARIGYQAVDVQSLVNLSDPQAIRAETIERLNASEPGSESYVENLRAGLQKSPLVSEAFAFELLNQAANFCETNDDAVTQASILGAAFRVAAHFGASEHLDYFMQAFRQSLKQLAEYYLELNLKTGATQMQSIEHLFQSFFQGFRNYGLRDELNRCLTIVEEVAAKPREAPRQPATSRIEFQEEDRAKLLILRQITASGRYLLGDPDAAQQAMEETRKFLFKRRKDVFDIDSATYKYLAPSVRKLIASYLVSLGQAPIEMALARFGELFEFAHIEPKMIPITDNFATCTHCVISQLTVVESVMQAIVSDDFTLNQESRRILEEDEYIVRRRIHADVADAMAEAK